MSNQVIVIRFWLQFIFFLSEDTFKFGAGSETKNRTTTKVGKTQRYLFRHQLEISYAKEKK